MMLPLTRVQKIIAYSTLFLIGLWTLFGLFTIWLLLTEY